MLKWTLFALSATAVEGLLFVLALVGPYSLLENWLLVHGTVFGILSISALLAITLMAWAED